MKYKAISKNLIKPTVRKGNEDLSTAEISFEEQKWWVSTLTQTHKTGL